METKQELVRAQELLMKHPEIDRAAFTLRVEQKLSYEEIARILEISLSSAKVKVHRIRKNYLKTD